MNIPSEMFVKVNHTEFRMLMKELDVYEKAFLVSIMMYVGYEDCSIRKDNGVPLNVKDFSDISGMSERKMFSVLSSLREKNVICKDKIGKDTVYFMNPWLCFKGNKLNKVLRCMFEDYRIRSNGMTKWKCLK